MVEFAQVFSLDLTIVTSCLPLRLPGWWSWNVIALTLVRVYLGPDSDGSSSMIEN